MIHEIHVQTRLLIAGDGALPVPAEFRYDSEDPYAVKATFHAAGDMVEWIFARDLLYGGLTNDMGIGDVRMWPCTDSGVNVMYISLSSPEGEALIECPIPEMKGFLDDTYQMVPAGNESVPAQRSVEDALTKILSESW